jgi:myo-inositol 2-dehydrogenase / D-chiro-inositol 1-dehydrogenase
MAREEPGRAAPIMTIESESDAEPPSRAARGALRVAVAGLGTQGVAHAATLATFPKVELVGLADPDGAARRNARGMGLRAPLHARLETLLAREKPDAVWVCGPVPERAALALQVLKSGSAAFIESPLALAYGDAVRVVDEARRADIPLAVSHRLAYLPVFAMAHEEVAAGAIGRVRQVRASLYVSRVFSAAAARRLTYGGESGVVAHAALDLLLVLIRMLGAPVEVRATANRLFGPHEDELHARMKLADGTDVGFDCSWSVPGYPRPANVIELDGEKGHLLVSEDAIETDARESVAMLMPSNAAYAEARAHTRRTDAELPQPARFDLDGEGSWLEDQAFVAWLNGGPMHVASGADALRAQAVLHALYESARADGKPLALPEGQSA